MQRDAYISPDGKYRYWLSRIWDLSKPSVTFIGLNPSTADGMEDDPTITKCIQYAKHWEYGGLFVANLFAFRDTHQTQIWNEPDPFGPDNDKWIAELATKSSMVVVAWGDGGKRLNRGATVCQSLPNLHCLKVNRSGEPHHPLYLPPQLNPQRYTCIRGIR